MIYSGESPLCTTCRTPAVAERFLERLGLQERVPAAGRWLLRNVCVALENWVHPSAVLRVHAAWALGGLVRSGGVRARFALEARLAVAADERVREENRVVLGQ